MNDAVISIDKIKNQISISKRIYMISKRVADFSLALFFLTILSPLFLIISLLIRKDGGKAFYIQERSGKNDKAFNLYKFRSMVPNNDYKDASKGDKFTKIGKILRKTSLDELPQLINILKGEMSFIGPRPWVTDYSKNFTRNQKKRLDVLPGITGLAQCSGRNDLSIFDKIKLDIEYVNNLSLIMDTKIIFKTIKAVFKSEGIATTDTKQSFHHEIEQLKDQFKSE